MTNSSSGGLADFLRRGRNGDGGWGYQPGKSSRLEPTAWATLALGFEGAENGDVLRTWPVNGGLLRERPGGAPNYGFHGLALLVLRALDLEHASGSTELLAGIQGVKGIALARPMMGRQDNRLQAWSWTAETFSWVEPTAWCLLALKKWRKVGAHINPERIDVAERMLINRTCLNGGWNYGNAEMLGQELRAYVPTTAIALLAMQDRGDEPAVTRSLDYLDKNATSERSGTALALALLALRAYERDTAQVMRALIGQVPTTLEFQNNASIALALCAMNPAKADGAFSL